MSWKELLDFLTEQDAPELVEALKSRSISKVSRSIDDDVDVRPYNPGTLTTLRERLVADQARRARQYLDDFAVQASRRDLSPSEFDKIEELKDFVSKSGDVIKDIRQQRARQAAFERREALRPARERFQTVHRKADDFKAAMRGALDREARHNARLSRAAFERAKATAARRRSQTGFKPNSYAERRYRFEKARERGLLGEECVEYGKRGFIRAQVLFAKHGAKGHHSAKKFSALGCGEVW